MPKEEAEGRRASAFGFLLRLQFILPTITFTPFWSNSPVLSAVRPLIDIFASPQNKIECQQSKKKFGQAITAVPLSSEENRPSLSLRLMRQYQGRMICIPSSPENPLVGSTEAMHLLLHSTHCSEYIPSLFPGSVHVSGRRSNNKLGTITFELEKTRPCRTCSRTC